MFRSFRKFFNFFRILKISGYILKEQKSSEYPVIVKLSRKQFVLNFSRYLVFIAKYYWMSKFP